MKDRLTAYFHQALEHLEVRAVVAEEGIHFSRPKNPEHGDWSTNIALQLSARNQGNPRQWAERIVAALPEMTEVLECHIAGPGFINLTIKEDSLNQVLVDISSRKERYGCTDIPADAPVTLVEYLSTNPTGPLHVGHGRVAVFGSALVAIMGAAGHKVCSEYYINDAGRQIDILVLSVLVRAGQQLCDQSVISADARTVFDQLTTLNIYQGEYLQTIAAALLDEHLPQPSWANDLLAQLTVSFEQVGQDGSESMAGGGEAALDKAIAAVKQVLGNAFEAVRAFVLEQILNDIRNDLEQSGVRFDNWFSEHSLTPTLASALAQWRSHEDVYTQDGALWFASSRHGDDKDRVLLRQDGSPTYFAMDLLYHGEKISRHYHRLINILGADHHGYVLRLRTAVSVLYQPRPVVESALVQFVRLHDGDQAVQMSTRSGQFVSLRSLRERIGCDALRFYFLLSDVDQGLDFDLSLVVQQNNDNPLYYVQYACVRCRQVLGKASDRQMPLSVEVAIANLALLRRDSERELITALERYPEIISKAASRGEPAILVRYVRELATALHANYGDQPYLIEEQGLRNARLLLVSSTLQVLSNALGLLAINVPEKM